MAFSGGGYTPGGPVDLFIASFATDAAGSLETSADATGAISGRADTPDVDRYLGENDWSATAGAAANDRTLVQAGAGPEQCVGATTFTLSRWDVQVEQPNGARPRAARPMRVTAKGYTNARGDTLYVHYRRARRTVKTLKLGRLTATAPRRCGARCRGDSGRALRARVQRLAPQPEAGPRINLERSLR